MLYDLHQATDLHSIAIFSSVLGSVHVTSIRILRHASARSVALAGAPLSRFFFRSRIYPIGGRRPLQDIGYRPRYCPPRPLMLMVWA